VHSFGETGLGWFFGAFLMAAGVVSFGLLFWRRAELASENELDSLLSRESTFLYNNLILVVMCLVVFVGTCWPFFYELLYGEKVTVAAAYFDRVNVPIGLALLFLIGFCPLIAWRKTSAKNLQRNFLLPTMVSLLSGGVLFWFGVRRMYPLLCGVLCVFVVATIVMEFYRGVRARRAMTGENPVVALGRLIWRNKRRFGGYIVHLGVVLIYLGIAGSSAYKVEKEVSVKEGEEFRLGEYVFRYERLTKFPTASKYVFSAVVSLFRDGRKVDVLTPEKNIHYKQAKQPVTEVSIYWNLLEDVYLILAGFEEDGRAAFRAVINPLVVWIWIGGVVMAVGSVVAVWPDRRQRRRS